MTLNKYSEGDTPVYTVHSFEFHRHLENSAANISKDIGQLTCFIELALSNSMKLSHARPWGNPRRVGHGGEIWQNVFHWRREWQTTSVFLPWEPHEQYEKAKL